MELVRLRIEENKSLKFLSIIFQSYRYDEKMVMEGSAMESHSVGEEFIRSVSPMDNRDF